MIKRFQTTFILLLIIWVGALHADVFSTSSGLLYRIHKPGGAVSYLFGTMHSENERVLKLGDQVNEYLDQTQRLVLEVELDPGAMLASMTYMVIADGRDLEQILGADLYAETVAAVETIGIPEVAVRQFKPWAVATLLSLPPTQTGQFLDLVLYNRAKSAGMEIIGLETVQEQLSLFDQLPEQDQIVLLKQTLAQFEDLPELHDQLLNAYLEGDLNRLSQLMDVMNGEVDQEVADRFKKVLISDRNQKMLQRILPILDEGPVVIAVGALHLPGANGLLNLLFEQGFIVEKVF